MSRNLQGFPDAARAQEERRIVDKFVLGLLHGGIHNEESEILGLDKVAYTSICIHAYRALGTWRMLIPKSLASSI